MCPMAAKVSAGVLLFRRTSGSLEVLLVHPGGPFWSKKDDGAWFLPKGEIEPDEEPLACAKREFREELGHEPPAGEYKSLGDVKNKSGKKIFAWAVEGDFEPALLVSNTFRLEWPPRSGIEQDFPEVDRASFFSGEEARRKVHPAELPLLERLEQILAGARA